MRQYEMCVSSRVVNLAEIAEFVGEHARRSGMDEDAVYDLQTAVDEACTNAMQHAYGGEGDGEVRVCCYEEEGEFVVRVTDHGQPFDPASVPEPNLQLPLEDRDIGGLGLYFMRQMVDRVEFGTLNGQGNQVTLRKRYLGAAQ